MKSTARAGCHSSSRRGTSRKPRKKVAPASTAMVSAANQKNREGGALKSPPPGKGFPSHSSHS